MKTKHGVGIKKYFNNYYGEFKDGGKCTNFFYRVCHSAVTGSIYNNLIFSCVYTQQPCDPDFKYQARWFDYLLDPETSPFRDMLDELEYEVLRDEQNHPVLVVIKNIKTLKLNCVVVMHMMKFLRNFFEHRTVWYWKHAVDNNYDEKKLFEAWTITTLFRNYDNDITPASMGEHASIKLKVSDNYWNKRLNPVTLHKLQFCNTRNYVQGSMQQQSFGDGFLHGNYLDSNTCFGANGEVVKGYLSGFTESVGSVIKTENLVKNHDNIVAYITRS